MAYYCCFIIIQCVLSVKKNASNPAKCNTNTRRTDIPHNICFCNSINHAYIHHFPCNRLVSHRSHHLSYHPGKHTLSVGPKVDSRAEGRLPSTSAYHLDFSRLLLMKIEETVLVYLP